MQESNPWKIISSSTPYKNPWIRIREDKVITPSGAPGIYAVVESADSVIVLVLDEKQRLCIIRIFNYPSQSWVWQLPGGGGDGEDLLVAAKRELEEETGLRAKTWDHLGEARVSNGLMSERMAVFLARNLSEDGTREVSNEKIIDQKFVSLTELESMLTEANNTDCQTLTALYFFRKWLDDHK